MRFSYSVDMPTSSALLAQDKSSAKLTPLNRQKTKNSKGRNRLLVNDLPLSKTLFPLIYLLAVG
jgi:hypothetical protein